MDSQHTPRFNQNLKKKIQIFCNFRIDFNAVIEISQLFQLYYRIIPFKTLMGSNFDSGVLKTKKNQY